MTDELILADDDHNEWGKVGEIKYVVNPETGTRDQVNSAGAPMPQEVVPHEPLRHIEFKFHEFADSKTRRYIEGVLEGLNRPHTYATLRAADWEQAYQTVAAKCILGVRDAETKNEAPPEERDQFLDECVEWDDVFAILVTCKRRIGLARKKKENSKSRFDWLSGSEKPPEVAKT